MLILLASLLLSQIPASQAPPPAPVVLTGQVVSGVPPVPVSGAVVRVGAATTQTDPAGRFSLTVIVADARPAVLHVVVSAAGYIDEVLDTPSDAPVEIVLRPNPSFREDVVVSAPSTDSPVAPPTFVVQPNEVRAVPGAIDNVFRVLQTMPGVVATDDFGSRLSVRGGGPDENLTVMDGVEIHNPYRLFGLTSAFNPETIDRFELTPGGFGPKYGDRLSSIFLVDNRAGTTARRLTGSAAVSITDANVVLEGRLPHGANGSWLVTGRRTYYDLFAERVTHNQLPSFNDVQTKLAWTSRAGRQLTLFGLRSREATDATFPAGGSTHISVKDGSQNDVVSLSFLSPLGTRATSKTIVSWYRYQDGLGVNGTVEDEAFRTNAPGDVKAQSAVVFSRALAVRDVSVREDATIAISPRQALSVGFEAHRLPTHWGWDIRGDRNAAIANGSSVLGGTGLPALLDSSGDGDRAGGWVEDDLRVTPRVRIAGGLRVDWNRLASETIASPRLNVTVELARRTMLRLAAGQYTQSPGYEKLLQSNYFVDLSHTGSLGLTSERSRHLIAGLERDFGNGVSARVEGYDKHFDHMIIGRLETPEETAARVAQYAFPPDLAWSVPTAPEITTVPSNDGAGHSHGVDVYVQKRAQSRGDRLSGWMSYTWERTDAQAYGVTYPFDYDRRHAFSLVTTWRASERIDVAANLRIASGFPYTRAIGVRVASLPVPGATPGAPGSLVPARDQTGAFLWTLDNGGADNLNQSRLPAFARLDLRMTYMPSRTSRWQLYFEMINALDRRNADSESPKLQYDPGSDRPRLTFSPDGGFPRLPSFGFRTRL